MDEYLGNDNEARKDDGGFSPMLLPPGTYFTKVEAYLMIGIGLD